MIKEHLPTPNPQPYHICKVHFATQRDKDGRWITVGAMIQHFTPAQQPGTRSFLEDDEAGERWSSDTVQRPACGPWRCLETHVLNTEPRAVRRADGPGTGASEQLHSSSLKVPPARAVGRARLSPWLVKEQEDPACVTGNGVRLVALHKPTRRQVIGKGTLL